MIAILLRRGQRRWGEALLALALLLAVMAPWAVRNARVAGSPVLTLRGADIAGGTTTYKGRSLYRRFLEEPPSGIRHLATHPREAWQKVRPLALSAYYDLVPNLGGPFIAAFFLAAVFTRFPGDGLRPLRWVHYASIGLVAGAICVMNGHSRALAPFCPLAIVVGSACFLGALDGLAERVLGPRAKRRALTWGIGGFVALCWFPVGAMTFTLSPPDTATADELREVASAVAARDVGPVYADQPWVLAWYADLDALWIPQSVEELHKVEEAVGPIQHMLLSPVIGGAGPEEELAVWANLYRSAPSGIPFERFLAEDAVGTNRDWVLFRRLPEGAVERAADAADTPE